MKWCLIGLGILLGGLAVASNMSMNRQKGYAHKIKHTSQTIKVADLSANGPGDNPYVTLTDFRFVEKEVQVSVWEGNRNKMTGGAYFPLEPARKGKKKDKDKEKGPEEKTPRVVVVTSAETPAGVKAFLKRTSITGMVKGSFDEMWVTEKKPVDWEVEGKPTEKVWLVWEGDRPPRTDLAQVEKAGYGLGLAALGFLAAGALAFAREGKKQD